MIQFTLPVVAGLLFAVLIAGVLIFVGMKNIQTGQKAMARARIIGEDAVWHRQISILFGMNNIVFGVLVALVALFSVIAVRNVKYAVLVLVALALLTSLALVVRCVGVALQAGKKVPSGRK